VSDASLKVGRTTTRHGGEVGEKRWTNSFQEWVNVSVDVEVEVSVSSSIRSAKRERRSR